MKTRNISCMVFHASAFTSHITILNINLCSIRQSQHYSQPAISQSWCSSQTTNISKQVCLAISVVWDKGNWNENKSKKCVQTILFDIGSYFEISVFEITRVDCSRVFRTVLIKMFPRRPVNGMNFDTRFVCVLRMLLISNWFAWLCQYNHLYHLNIFHTEQGQHWRGWYTIVIAPFVRLYGRKSTR